MCPPNRCRSREFAWTDRHARRFINVSRVKFDTVSNLDIDVSALYLIAAPKTLVHTKSDSCYSEIANCRLPSDQENHRPKIQVRERRSRLVVRQPQASQRTVSQSHAKRPERKGSDTGHGQRTNAAKRRQASSRKENNRFHEFLTQPTRPLHFITRTRRTFVSRCPHHLEVRAILIERQTARVQAMQGDQRVSPAV